MNDETKVPEFKRDQEGELEKSQGSSIEVRPLGDLGVSKISSDNLAKEANLSPDLSSLKEPIEKDPNLSISSVVPPNNELSQLEVEQALEEILAGSSDPDWYASAERIL